MTTTPTVETGSAGSRSRSIQASQEGSATDATNHLQDTSLPVKSVMRRSGNANQMSSSGHASKDGLVKTTRKPRPPAVAERDIAEWLGLSELTDEPRAARSAKTSTLAPGADGRVSATQAVADDVILARVAERLVERNISSFARIGLDLKSGVLTVKGTVASKGERLLLIRILQTTPGIQKVKDGLVVGRGGSEGPRLSGLVPSMPSIPSLPSFSFPSISSITENLSSIKPMHAGVALASLVLIGFFCWPRSVVRPVAVYPVKGRVVLEGQPLAEATVVLHPVGKSKLPSGLLPRGTAEADGGFVIKTFESADGSPEGEFVATVHLIKPVLMEGDMVPGPDLSPVVYRSPETSPFRLKITRETKEISLLELHKTGEPRSLNN